MIEAPPILGPLEFAGVENQLILIECDEGACVLELLGAAISYKDNIIFTPDEVMPAAYLGRGEILIANINSIAKINNTIRSINMNGSCADFFIIHRIDMMDIHFSKKERGAQINAYVSMMASPKNLRGANVIVTSCLHEWKLREIADKFISLRTQIQ